MDNFLAIVFVGVCTVWTIFLFTLIIQKNKEPVVKKQSSFFKKIPRFQLLIQRFFTKVELTNLQKFSKTLWDNGDYIEAHWLKREIAKIKLLLLKK
jgi:hypothetical protein